MACDMIGASKAYGNAVPTITYFNSRKDFWLMDPEDKVLLARLVEDYVC
jgi:hypothetical protein